jgi:hypothetical protein
VRASVSVSVRERMRACENMCEREQECDSIEAKRASAGSSIYDSAPTASFDPNTSITIIILVTRITHNNPNNSYRLIVFKESRGQLVGYYGYSGYFSSAKANYQRAGLVVHLGLLGVLGLLGLTRFLW